MSGTAPTAILSAQGVSVDYGTRRVLHEISAEWRMPSSTAIVGPSGSGKTTLLYALAGLETLSGGAVRLLGTDLSAVGADGAAAMRLRHAGFVFQQADLVPELTLRQNIELPMRLLKWTRADIRDRADHLVEELDLADAASRRPTQVSGGQAQRAAVARALAARPQVVFADEPTGALDSRNGERVISLLQAQCIQDQALLICVTHDPNIAGRMDRILAIADGRIEDAITQSGTSAGE